MHDHTEHFAKHDVLKRYPEPEKDVLKKLETHCTNDYLK
jgi:hypothetical protein